jgi:hypothetical protein
MLVGISALFFCMATIVFFNSGTGGRMISHEKVRAIRFGVRDYPDSCSMVINSEGRPISM